MKANIIIIEVVVHLVEEIISKVTAQDYINFEGMVVVSQTLEAIVEGKVHLGISNTISTKIIITVNILTKISTHMIKVALVKLTLSNRM